MGGEAGEGQQTRELPKGAFAKSSPLVTRHCVVCRPVTSLKETTYPTREENANHRLSAILRPPFGTFRKVSDYVCVIKSL